MGNMCSLPFLNASKSGTGHSATQTDYSSQEECAFLAHTVDKTENCQYVEVVGEGIM